MISIVFIIIILFLPITQQQCSIGHLSFNGEKCIFAQNATYLDCHFNMIDWYRDTESDCKQRAENVGIDRNRAFLVSISNAFENADTLSMEKPLYCID